MLKRKLFHSLKYRLTALSAVLVVGISALLIFNYICTVRAIQKETYLAMEGTLSLYNEHLNDNFRLMSLYLIEYSGSSEDLRTIAANKRSTVEWGAAVHRIQEKLSFAQALYASDGFFLYVPETNVFMSSTTPEGGVREAIGESIRSGEWSDDAHRGKWIPFPEAESGRLYRAIRLYGCYIGTWIHAPQFLEKLTGGSSDGTYYFADETGRLLGTDSSIEAEQISSYNPASYSFVDLNGVKQMMIAQKLSSADLYLTALIPNEQIESGVRSYLPPAVFVIAVTVLLLLSVILGMRHWVIRPTNRLTAAIRQLQLGNWNSSVEDKHSCTEFQTVNHAFNEMVSEVQALKIDIYEEQLNRQKIEMDYLKLQITPHFLINCLNTIYQLTDTDHPELAQRMARELSRHVRYTLSAGPVVPLSVEAQHVQNYVMLSNIRYRDAIALTLDIDPAVENCRVVPLMLLNFIENTVKHEVCIDKKIEIHLTAKHVEQSGEQWVSFQIWDTGGGFGADMLERIRDIERYVRDSTHHIGISNVFKRAKMLLGDCRFSFCNRPGAGAQIDILIPCTEFKPEGETL